MNKSNKSLLFVILIFVFSVNVFAEGQIDDSPSGLVLNAHNGSTYLPQNHDDLLYVYYKGTNTELSDSIVANYIHDYYESDYTNNRQNEFRWSAVLNKYRNHLASRINAVDLSTTYSFRTEASFATYNFDLGGFDVGNNIEYLFVDRRGLTINAGRTDTGLSSKGILIFMNNISGYNFLRMDRNEANALVDSRTRNGNVNRNITLHIFFNIVNFFPNTGIFLIAQMNNSISASILKIDVYDGTKKIGELSSKATSR